MLAALNILFLVFHTALVVFNVFGWISKATRKWNLLTLLLTLASWAGMGICYGMGYCICTDWHWEVRQNMGIFDDADSYLVLLVRKLSGWDPPIELVNTVAFWVFVIALTMSVSLNARDWVRARRGRAESSRM